MTTPISLTLQSMLLICIFRLQRERKWDKFYDIWHIILEFYRRFVVLQWINLFVKYGKNVNLTEKLSSKFRIILPWKSVILFILPNGQRYRESIAFLNFLSLFQINNIHFAYVEQFLCWVRLANHTNHNTISIYWVSCEVKSKCCKCRIDINNINVFSVKENNRNWKKKKKLL